MHQSVVELGTEICQSVVDARAHVIELRSRLAELAGRSGLKIASVGTHPFSHWRDQLITQGERYQEIVKDMQQLARANLIFGLHVHVGIPDRDIAIHVMNQARYFLPHIYALSVNSPFWVGQDTGLKGYRLKVFERFPRTGIPDAFESLSEYEDYCKLLVKTGCVDNAKKIWWDIRLHPFFDTLEVRVCDAQSRVDDTLAIAALIQAVIVKLHKLLRQNITFRIYRRRLLDENRWRASRYGIDGKLIDFGKEAEVDDAQPVKRVARVRLDRGKRARHPERDGAHRADHARRHRRGPATGGLGTHAGYESRGRSISSRKRTKD